MSVRLRPIDGEASEMARILAHPSLPGRRGLGGNDGPERTITNLAKEIEGLTESDTDEVWAVDADGIVGVATVGRWWDALTPWAHVVIDPERHREGLGTEACGALFAHLFLDTPAILVQFAVPEWDTAGVGFAGSLGGVAIGRNRRRGIRDGRYFDELAFAMPRDVWEERNAAPG